MIKSWLKQIILNDEIIKNYAKVIILISWIVLKNFIKMPRYVVLRSKWTEWKRHFYSSFSDADLKPHFPAF